LNPFVSNRQFTTFQIFETNITLDEALKVSDVVIAGVPSPKYKVDTGKLKEGKFSSVDIH
jgi:methylenetetrahydrofolate dehydrogenase (NAD+)